MHALFFEDINPGDAFVSTGRTITETDVVNFAGVSGDFNQIHLDAEAAKKSMYGQRVAYGMLGVSIATGLLDRLGLFRESMAAMLEIEDWKFQRPIFIGDTLHLRLVIESTRLVSRGDRGIVRRRLELINQRGEVVQCGIITVMVLCRSAALGAPQPEESLA
ncbi:MaoC/PaaZ C-terminal domain-containing protein [Microbacterium sp. UBA3394]|uniref:MaoC/PaaZ C-terminal domain-containing protein n=1 Tax=Microbacterium sp. UBA3394 TaxID=1946945 RepID=UPI00257F0FBE|nr:MaoC/PaaZ C-terminal domain-containing protein [Microbacterium sp. UBA3394]|tara:strand:+ start:157 stop:642 length:486 start_codon:yes stop_codon:yes gene_type:complete